MLNRPIIARSALQGRSDNVSQLKLGIARATCQSAVCLSDLVLERSALGAAMLDRNQAQQLINEGSPELFTTTTHKNIFEALRALKGIADYALLAAELARRGQLDDIGWKALIHLDDGVVPEILMSRRIDRLKELWKLRQLAGLAEELAPRIYEPCANSSEIMTTLYRQLEKIKK